MTDRAKLIKLYEKAFKEWMNNTNGNPTVSEFICDYLLANGVFLLPEDLRGTQDFSISAFIEAMQMYKEKDRYIKLPCKAGSEVFVSPNRGQSFHKAKIYGCDEKGVWLVWVNDKLLTEEDKHIVANPMKRTFYDWFLKVYTKEEAEQKLKELKSNANNG